jgi:hypothetical protein
VVLEEWRLFWIILMFNHRLLPPFAKGTPSGNKGGVPALRGRGIPMGNFCKQSFKCFIPKETAIHSFYKILTLRSKLVFTHTKLVKEIHPKYLYFAINILKKRKNYEKTNHCRFSNYHDACRV